MAIPVVKLVMAGGARLHVAHALVRPSNAVRPCIYALVVADQKFAGLKLLPASHAFVMKHIFEASQRAQNRYHPVLGQIQAQDGGRAEPDAADLAVGPEGNHAAAGAPVIGVRNARREVEPRFGQRLGSGPINRLEVARVA